MYQCGARLSRGGLSAGKCASLGDETAATFRFSTTRRIRERFSAVNTADLYDERGAELDSVSLQFQSLGGHTHFSGPVRTIRCFEDNALVKSALATPGNGSVLVVDGAGSLRTALMGDMIAASAVRTAGPASSSTAPSGTGRPSPSCRLGVKALGSNPRKSAKAGAGEMDVKLEIDGVTVRPGAMIWCDPDGDSARALRSCAFSGGTGGNMVSRKIVTESNYRLDPTLPLEQPCPKPPLCAPPGEVLTHRQTVTVMVGLMLGMFLSSLDQTIVSTSIYTIANDLDGLSLQAWATTAYLITSTVSTPLYGKLSDIFGRRPLYLIAILIFLAGSLYAGSVHSMTELAIARGIQGMGAGGLLALALTIIGDIVALKDRAKFQGYFMSVFGISSVLGPVIGGAFAGSANILGFDGWRWVFFINLPIGLAALAVVFLYLHLPGQAREAEDRLLGRRRHHPGDRAAPAGRRTGPQLGLDLHQLLPLLSGSGVVGIIAFLLAEKRAGDYALIPLRLFRNITFGLSSLLNFIIGVGMFGAIAMLPMYLQLVKGLTPTEAGLMMITFTVGILTGSITAGRTISASGTYRIFPILGTAVLTAAAVVMGLSLGVDTPLWVPGAIAVFFGLGLGFCMQPLTLAMQVSVPVQGHGRGHVLRGVLPVHGRRGWNGRVHLDALQPRRGQNRRRDEGRRAERGLPQGAQGSGCGRRPRQRQALRLLQERRQQRLAE